MTTNTHIARIKVFVTALPTHAAALAIAISVGAAELAKVLPQYTAGITRWSVTALAVVTGIVTVIRNVTRVEPDQVGLLLQPPPASPLVVIDKPPPPPAVDAAPPT